MRKIKDVYDKFRYILTTTQKKYAMLVFAMGVVAALLELLGVAIIVPIMNMLMDIETLKEKSYIQVLSKIMNLSTDIQIVWLICILTILVYLIKNLFFSVYSWVSMKFSTKVRRELAVRIMQTYMNQGYLFFVQNNTARLLQGMSGDVTSVFNILNSIFSIAIKLLTIVCIGGYILIQSREMALVLLILIVICFIIIQIIFRKPMRQNGKKSRELACECSQTAMEAIQGNKEILVMNKQDYAVRHYEDLMADANRVEVNLYMGAAFPAYIIEMVCIAGVLLAVAVEMGTDTDQFLLISRLTAMAVGAFRILPALGTISSGVNSITSLTPQLQSAYSTLQGVKLLETKMIQKRENEEKYRETEFRKILRVQNICFGYPDAEESVLKNVSLDIEKGQSIAFIGPSGAGKTTLADIILGLLKPNSGKIFMDDINIEELGGKWNEIIGYVPQSLYIIDDTIRKNIAFGEKNEDIDDDKIWQALEIAQLDDFVKKLPNGLNTYVGEWGVRFSGGQRQRLAIARALYRNPDILVLDEATAALDNETESEVMKAIERLQGYKTLIIVAHRLTTVKKCDTIYEVKNKSICQKEKAEIFRNE
ncbi:MAG: ABC transporter ATP-binding protein/permease [Lachnospiraceae bacterium]|nr:ABC transporter ATP-binding protein/permease [Lachnospiraceae bacterium]